MPDYIEWYLVELDEHLKRLRVCAQRREAIVSEVRDHLESSAHDFEKAGKDPVTAVKSAINLIGQPCHFSQDMAGNRKVLSLHTIFVWSLLPIAALIPIVFLLFTQPTSAANQSGWPWISLEVAYVYLTLCAVAMIVSLLKTRGWSGTVVCVFCLLVAGASVAHFSTSHEFYQWTTAYGDEREYLVKTPLIEEEIKIAERHVKGRTNIVTDLEFWDAIYSTESTLLARPDTTGVTIIENGNKWVFPIRSAETNDYMRATGEYLTPREYKETSWFESHADFRVAQAQWQDRGPSHLRAARRELRDKKRYLAVLQGSSMSDSGKWSLLLQRHWDPMRYVFALLLSLNILFFCACLLYARLRNVKRKLVLV